MELAQKDKDTIINKQKQLEEDKDALTKQVES